MSDEQAQQDDSNPLSIFPSESQIPVTGLAFLGSLTKDVGYCGHTWTLKTLRPAEKAAIALAVMPWRNTIAEPQVYANAHVGLAITSVDGDPTWCTPIGPDLNDFARTRLNMISDPKHGWHQATLDFLYEEWLNLEEQAMEEMERLRNLSPRSLADSLPSVASLIAQVTSSAPTSGDSPS